MLASSRAERLPRQVGASRSRPVARIHPFLFIAPSVLMLVVLLALPITQALLRTFQTDAGWGVENYIRAVRDDHLACARQPPRAKLTCPRVFGPPIS